MGMGCGGASRIGMRTGNTEKDCVNLIRKSIDAGINFMDTADTYGTEAIVGKAIKDTRRMNLVLSTKVNPIGITPSNLERSIERSLRAFRTDYIDIFNLHGVVIGNYNYLVSKIIPVLQKAREQGKIRFIGITESGKEDPQHQMLQRALQDDFWDTMMVGFNMINQTARERVLRKALKKNIGIINMYAVRNALSNPRHLKIIIQDLIKRKEINPSDIDRHNPLHFLIHDGGARTIIDAAYRFCRYEPGIHVVLSGTGHHDHLKANIESFHRPPLPREDVLKLKNIFRNVDSVLGN